MLGGEGLEPADGKERDEGDARLGAGVDQRVVVAGRDVVQVLHADDVGGGARPGELGRRDVGDAQVVDEAFRAQGHERFQRGFEPGVGVPAVAHAQVHHGQPVDAEGTQVCLNAAAQALGGKAALLGGGQGDVAALDQRTDLLVKSEHRTKSAEQNFKDVNQEAFHSDYKDFGGVKVPTHIVERQGDYPTLDLMISDAKANVAANIAPPQRGGGAPAGGGGPQGPSSQKLGDGVFLIMPAYAAIAVDMKDGIVVLEGPQSTMRGEQIIAEVHKDIPNKPIKYVFNTHSHFDHSSGLRAFVAEGATIITSQTNKGYFEKIFALPHTLVPDKLSQNHAKVKVELVGDKRVLTDGVHTIEIHKTQGSLHNEGLLFAYLPKEKVLLEADSFNPPATADAAAPPNPANALLVDNINRLKLDVETLVPVHYPADGRKVSIEELKRAVGQRATK